VNRVLENTVTRDCRGEINLSVGLRKRGARLTPSYIKELIGKPIRNAFPEGRPSRPRGMARPQKAPSGKRKEAREVAWLDPFAIGGGRLTEKHPHEARALGSLLRGRGGGGEAQKRKKKGEP